MRVAIRDLRNDTKSVIDAVERGVDVVLTRRGHPIARIVPIEPDEDDLATWLDEVMSNAHDSGLLTEVERLVSLGFYVRELAGFGDRVFPSRLPRLSLNYGAPILEACGTIEPRS